MSVSSQSVSPHLVSSQLASSHLASSQVPNIQASVQQASAEQGSAVAQWALITGASSGIGRAFSELFAKDGINLVLVARSKQILENIKLDLEVKYGVRVVVIIADLSQIKEAEELVAAVDDKKITVDYLVNNAGFGNHGAFLASDWGREKDMIELNIVALTYLSKLFGQSMADRGRGKIVNVASTAGFIPGPYMAVYFATKAYVLHLSEAIGYEMRPKGVSVTALCPGPTSTQFAEAAKATGMGIFQSKHLPTAEQVAVFGYKAMQKGKPVAVHTFSSRAGIWLTRLLPRQIVVRIVGRAQH